MTISDMYNLFTGYNETENYTVFIVALDRLEALDIAIKYGNDSGLENDWQIRDFNVNDKANCDYILV